MWGEIDRTVQKQQEVIVIATAAIFSLEAIKLATLKPLVSDCSNLSKMSHNSVKSQHTDMKYIFFLQYDSLFQILSEMSTANKSLHTCFES